MQNNGFSSFTACPCPAAASTLYRGIKTNSRRSTGLPKVSTAPEPVLDTGNAPAFSGLALSRYGKPLPVSSQFKSQPVDSCKTKENTKEEV